MNIIFVSPIIYTNRKFIPHVPLGLLSLASILCEKDQKYNIKIVDLNTEIENKNVVVDRYFYHSVANFLLSYNPDIIGFTTLCDSYAQVLNISKLIKFNSPNTCILFGGPQASIVDYQTLKNFDSVDVIVRGEAEETIKDLIDYLMGSMKIDDVSGITYKKNGKPIRTNDRKYIENLDVLPMPAYHLYPIKEFVSQDIPIPVDVGRGCPYNCKFCSTSIFWRNTWRLKTPSRIVAEIQYLNKNYNVQNFDMIHDAFTVKKEIIRNFCNLLIKMNLNIKWKCGARIDLIDTELLELMALSGCNKIFFGIESGSAEMQRTIGKNLKMKFPSDVLKILNETLEKGIVPETSFVFGYPSETENDLKLTLNMIHEIRRIGIDITQFHILAPHPGTEFMLKCGENLMFDGYFSDVSSGYNQAGDIDVIIKYPKIFSAFHYYQLKYLDRKIIIGLDKTIQILYYCIKWSLFLILDSLKINLYDIYCNWVNSEKCNVQDIIKDDNLFLYRFKSFLLNFIENQQLDMPFLYDLLKYEMAIYEIYRKSNLTNRFCGNRKYSIDDDQYLISRGDNLFIMKFEYDIQAIIKDIKFNKIEKSYSRSNSYILLYPEKNNIVSSVNIDKFSYQFIQQLNNKCFKNIIEKMELLYPDYDRKNIYSACLKILFFLEERNLVSISCSLACGSA